MLESLCLAVCVRVFDGSRAALCSLLYLAVAVAAMVRLVEYSDSSDDEDAGHSSAQQQQQNGSHSAWRQYVQPTVRQDDRDELFEDDEDVAMRHASSSGRSRLASSSERPESAKRINTARHASPFDQPMADDRASPFVAPVSTSAAASASANGPGTGTFQSSSATSPTQSVDAHPAFVFGQAQSAAHGASLWPPPAPPQQQQVSDAPTLATPMFKTAFAYDAFASMKTRLAGRSDSSSSGTSQRSDASGAAMTSVFGSSATSSSSDAPSGRPAFRPYDKGAAATPGRSASTRRRPHVRRPQASETQSASSTPVFTFGAGGGPVPRTQSASARGDDAHMASSLTGKRAPVFTFGASEQEQPAQTQQPTPPKRITPLSSRSSAPSTGTDGVSQTPSRLFATANGAATSAFVWPTGDAVMNEAATGAVEFTSVFQGQRSAPRSSSSDAAAAPARPVFHFGQSNESSSSQTSSFGTAAPTATPTPQSWPFSASNETEPSMFSPPADGSRRRSLNILKRDAPRKTASSTGAGAAPATSASVGASRVFEFHQRRTSLGPHCSTTAEHASSSANSVVPPPPAPPTVQFGGQATSTPAPRSTATFVFGAAQPAPSASATAPAQATHLPNPSVGARAQFPFGMPAPSTPFVFGQSASTSAENSAPEAPPRAGDFTFEPRRTDTAGFASPQRWTRKGGERSNRTLRASFRTKATLGGAAPTTPTPTAAAPPATTPRASTPGLPVDSPFGLGAKPTGVRTSVFQHKRTHTEYGAPADPFAMPVFHRTPAAEAADPPSSSSSAKAPAPDVYTFGSSASGTAQAQRTSTFTFSDSFRVKQPSSSASASAPTPSSGDVPPAPPQSFPTRRILRAVRPTDAKRTTAPSSTEDAAGDTAMQGEDASAETSPCDGSEWGELKRLGGVAYANRHFRDAAELYRQSIEAVGTYLARYPDADTAKDKAKLHANRAASLMMLQQYSDAQFECEQSIATDPSYTRAYIRLSRLHVLFGDVAHAKAHVGVAKQQLAQLFFLNVDPNDRASIDKVDAAIVKLTALERESAALVDAHEWAKALKVVEDALAVAPYSRAFQALKTQALFQRKYVCRMATSLWRLIASIVD